MVALNQNDDESKMSSFSTRTSRTPQAMKFNRPKLSYKGLGLIGVVLLLCAAFGFGGGWLGARSYNGATALPTSTAVKQRYISDEGSLISSIAKTVGEGVVSINATQTVNSQDVFGLSQPSSQEAAGTGFIISSDGTIITNRHVVPTGTSNVSVTLADGTRYDNVKVLGRTSSSSSLDVAFLKITDLKDKKLSPVTLGDSSKVKVGDRVIAIGNALGQFQNTVTSGIISGFGRDVTAGDQSGAAQESLTDLFQTDAAINEGNSGGPLVSVNGEVIGMNTAVASSAQNIGFAIPVNDIKGLVTSVLGKGELQQPYLGVRYVSLTDDLASQFSLKVKRGAYIVPSSGASASIISGSPAERAGLKEKDVITKVNNIKIDDNTNLTSALSRLQVGDKVNLTVIRNGKLIHIIATLGNTPS